MQLQKQHPDNLKVITLNVDFDGDAEPTPDFVDGVYGTLTDLDITCVNYVASSPLEAILAEFEVFGLPAAILYDREGRLVQKFDGEVNIESVISQAIVAHQ